MIYIDRIPQKFKGTVMQIGKALINDRLPVWIASKTFHIPTIHNFGVIYRWTLLFSKNVTSYVIASIVFLLINKTLRLNNLKTRTAMNTKLLLFVICVGVIIYLLLYNFHDCTFDWRKWRGTNTAKKKCLYSELFWSAFSRIRTEYYS